MRRHAFTLIELLVVISITAVLMAVLLPSLSQAREAARTAICKSRIRTMYQAIESYRLDNKEWYPVSALTADTFWKNDYFFLSQVEPYLGVIKNNGVPQVAHFGIKSSPSSNFIMCPSSTFTPGMSLTEARKVGFVFESSPNRYGNYWISAHFGVDGTDPAIAPTKTVRGRPSTTVMLGEVYASNYGRFAASAGLTVVKYYHPNVSTHFLLGDGQIRQTSATTSLGLNLENMYLVNGP